MSDNSLFWTALLDNVQANILIFARVIGLFAFNPIFSRNNIPSRVKIGASFALTLMISSSVISNYSTGEIYYESLGAFAVAALIEVAIGVILGFFTNMFVSMLLYTGEIMDMTTGLGMAKVYDPATQTQQAIFGTYLNYMFIIYFFITNSHLQYVRIYLLSYQFIPLGADSINPDVWWIIAVYFGNLFVLATKLAMPIIIAEVILEIAIGILMKAVPTIQVMTVNIQLKLLAGLLLIFALSVPLSDAIDRYMGDMLESVEGLLPYLAE